MPVNPETVPLQDWWQYNIELEVECRACGLKRRVSPQQIMPHRQGNLPIDARSLESLRFVCSQCGGRQVRKRMVVWR